MTQTVFRLTFAALFSILLCWPAHAAVTPWTSLTPKQQEALAPLESQWHTLPETQQKRLLATTNSFHQLTPGKKQRYLKNLTAWSKLTQEQRNRAREKYKAFSKIPAENREEVKRMVRKQEAEKDISYANEYIDETPSSYDSGK